MKPIKTAIASYGMSGNVFHGPLLKVNPGFSVSHIWERTKNNSKDLFPDAMIVRDFKTILQDKSIELVVVNTPDHTHYELTRLCIEQGKHVVVEKPFTQTVQEANELIDLADKQGVVLSVFQNRRWDGDFLTIQKIIHGETLGRLVEFESHFDRFRNFIRTESWKEQSGFKTGTLYNLGSHMIDQALQLFGMPEKIYADIRILRDEGEVDDFFDIDLIYNTNIKVRVKGTYLAREPLPRYTLHGTEGSFLKWGLDPQEETLNNGKLPGDKGWGEDSEENYGIIHTNIDGKEVRGKVKTEKGCYEEYYKNIYDVIRSGKELAVKPLEALNTIKIIELAYLSNDQKQVLNIY